MPSKQPFDPLTYLPSAEAIRQRLQETKQLARRLTILLRVAEQIESTTSREGDAAHLKGGLL